MFSIAACGDSAGPDDDALELGAALIVAALTDAGALSAAPGADSWQCPDGGSVVLEQFVGFDGASLIVTGTVSFGACGLPAPRGSAFVFEGDLEMADHWTVDDFGRVTGSQGGSRTGTLSWMRKARTGSCRIDLSLTGVDPISITGTACGESVTESISPG
jgi:hypothetical protein